MIGSQIEMVQTKHWRSGGMGGEVGWELSGDSMFQCFRQRGEVGNAMEIGRDIRVQSRFFEDGGDSS